MRNNLTGKNGGQVFSDNSLEINILPPPPSFVKKENRFLRAWG
jgi:hypothetical protein